MFKVVGVKLTVKNGKMSAVITLSGEEMCIRDRAMALRNDSVEIRDPKLKAEEKLAIILGTEGEGLDAETMELCDYTVKIPMSHGVDSLNVAAASAVAFWELGQRS